MKESSRFDKWGGNFVLGGRITFLQGRVGLVLVFVGYLGALQALKQADSCVWNTETYEE